MIRAIVRPLLWGVGFLAAVGAALGGMALVVDFFVWWEAGSPWTHGAFWVVLAIWLFGRFAIWLLESGPRR